MERLEDLSGEVDTWSVSALKSIGTCGKQYEFRYRLPDIEAAATPPLAFGSAVHKCIERLHKEGDKWDAADWQMMWSDEWFDYASEVDWAGYRKGQFDKLGMQMIANYIHLHRDAELLEIEYKFPAKKDEGYYVSEFPVKGVIDQVRRLPSGRLLVVDLKTSKDKPDPLLLRADPQFTIYHHVIREKYGEDPLLAWLHLRTGELIHTKRTVADLEITEAMLREAQFKVNHKMFARNVQYGCKYCPFMQPCLSPLNEDASE